MNKQDMRILKHPVLQFDQKYDIPFHYNGRSMTGCQGQTVAGALYANGVRIFSRSFKYHRPRGLSCLAGHCSNCLMRVNDIPNVRTCSEPLKPGMRVESQNAWPSLEFDVAALAGYLDMFIRPGFQYKRFIRPRWAYHIWERFLRQMAGIGKIGAAEDRRAPKRHQAEPEMVVVGAGVAGMQAALRAARAGAEVWLLEKQASVGGGLRYRTDFVDIPMLETKRRGFELVSILAEELKGMENCRVMTDATAFAWYDEEVLAVVRPQELWELKPRSVIVATGSYEYPMVFENNDLPGIFLAGGLQRLMHRDGVRPGRRAVVMSTNSNGYALARQLLEAGVSVVGVADPREKEAIFTSEEARYISEAGIPIHARHCLQRAIGGRRVKGVTLVSAPPPGSGEADGAICLACDTICVSGSRAPANELIFQRTCQGSYVLESPYQTVRRPDIRPHMALEKDFYVAGEASGSLGPMRAYLEGEIAGLSASMSLGYGDSNSQEERDALERLLGEVEN